MPDGEDFDDDGRWNAGEADPFAGAPDPALLSKRSEHVEPDMARSVSGPVASCIHGSSIWRRSSCLIDRIKTRIASELVSIVDAPLLPQGSGSRAFDGEGLLSRRNVVVENGMLKSNLLDTYSVKKLGLESTASASRSGSAGGGPSTSNFILQKGTSSLRTSCERPRRPFVTEMIGGLLGGERQADLPGQ